MSVLSVRTQRQFLDRWLRNATYEEGDKNRKTTEHKDHAEIGGGASQNRVGVWRKTGQGRTLVNFIRNEPSKPNF
jgi:hypothetical protein